ncbi:MAG: hypothetical protein ACP5DC_10840, partial [Halothiobacillaceae bacterium]
GPVATAAGHYRRQAPERGFAVLRDGEDRYGVWRLTLSRRGQHAVVSLRPADRSGKMTDILVMISKPPGRPGQQE